MEGDRDGWHQPFGPDGIEIANGTFEDGHDFGNRRLDSDIEVLKSSDAPPEGVETGTMVDCEFVVTNTGELTLFDIVVEDDHIGLIGVIDERAPGESETLTASAVLDATTTNVVEASGIDIFERTVSDDDTHTVEVFAPFTPAPEPDPGGQPAAGDDPAPPAPVQQAPDEEPYLPYPGCSLLFLLVVAGIFVAAGPLLRRAVGLEQGSAETVSGPLRESLHGKGSRACDPFRLASETRAGLHFQRESGYIPRRRVRMGPS